MGKGGCFDYFCFLNNILLDFVLQIQRKNSDLQECTKTNCTGTQSPKRAITRFSILEYRKTVTAFKGIQCIRKVFTALYFFHILLCYRLNPKWNKFLFSPQNSTHNIP